MYEQHIMGENEQHQGGQVKPTSAGTPALTGPPAAPPGATGGI